MDSRAFRGNPGIAQDKHSQPGLVAITGRVLEFRFVTIGKQRRSEVEKPKSVTAVIEVDELHVIARNQHILAHQIGMDQAVVELALDTSDSTLDEARAILGLDR